MTEGLLILALLIIGFLYVVMKSNQEKIESQNTTIRKLKGEENENDKLIDQCYIENSHFRFILGEVKEDEIYKDESYDIQISEAYDRLKI